MVDMIGFVDAVRNGLIRGLQGEYKTRACRSEYWWFQLFALLLSVALNVIATIYPGAFTSIVYGLVSIFLSVFGTFMLIRRLHDVGQSGWHYFWSLTIIGIPYILYLLVKNGDKEANQYGPPCAH
jgi:uncharacterized membrane protein YhaH (DUF805 family)